MRVLLFLIAATLHAQTFLPSPVLDSAVREIVHQTTSRFAPALSSGKIALTVVDLTQPAAESASYRGDEPIYPASVVKLFYLVAAHAWMQSGALASTPELDRAIRDMIVDSSNDATGLVVDSITNTTSGPELDPAAYASWFEKRNVVNRYFASLGYTGINVNQKPLAEGPYGRERQARGLHFENNNRLTTSATARLLYNIVTGHAVTATRSRDMMKLLHRDFRAPSADPDDQAHGFSGESLPAGAQYYSKAGWTATTRHDATYLELPNGARYIAVVFTVDNAKNTEIIPFTSKLFVERFAAKHSP